MRAGADAVSIADTMTTTDEPFDPDNAAAIAVEQFGGTPAVTVLQR